MKMFLKGSNIEIKGDIVCTFDIEDDKHIIVLTNYNSNKDKNINIMSYYYENINNVLYLEPINDEDLEIVKVLISNLKGVSEDA